MASSFDIVKKELMKELKKISDLNIELSRLQEEREDLKTLGPVGDKSNLNQQTIDKTVYDDICSLLKKNTEIFKFIKDLCQQPRTEKQIPSLDVDKLTEGEKQPFLAEMWETFRKILRTNRHLVEILRKEIKERCIDKKYEHGKAIDKKNNVTEIIDDILKEISEVREKIDDLWKPSDDDNVEVPRLPHQETDSKSEEKKGVCHLK